MKFNIDRANRNFQYESFDRYGNKTGGDSVVLNPLILTQSTPDKKYRNPVVNGFRAPSPWSLTMPTGILVKARFPTYHARGLYASSIWSAEGGSWASVPTAWPKPSTDALWTKARNAVAEETMDVAMVLAEMQGSVDLVTSGLSRIARSMELVRLRRPHHFYYLLNGRTRDNRRPTDKFLRESAGTYLEWKYGVMPSVMDVQGGLDSLTELEQATFFGRAPVMTARAREVATSELTTQAQVSIERFRAYLELSWQLKTELYARIDYEVNCEALRGLRRFGIGWSTIPTVAFERTPFSFVLNMAIPIADIIKAWGALAGVSVRAVCLTTYREANIDHKLMGTEFVGYPTDPEVRDVDVTKKFSSFTRNPLPRVPIPMPYIRNPVKTGNLSTVLALFTQLRKS